ncbi:hypothetical protein K440DRAFT_657290 [Wilcoxina mikolae CBS 423.85]|nr:hypothetical protein K440DRAFT_657290 [Wilcoxina mikolae CBS 423.85]
MHFLTTSLLFLTTLVAATPQPSYHPHKRAEFHPLGPQGPLPTGFSDSGNFASLAHKRAIARGIDPHGPRPTDFTHDNGEWVSFKEESDYAVWAAAQSGLKVKKRVATEEGTGIEVVVWTQTNCKGDGVHFYNLKYDQEYFDANIEFVSMSQTHHTSEVPNLTQDIHLRRWIVGTTTCTDLGPNSVDYVNNIDGHCFGSLPTFTCFDIVAA